MAGMKLLAVFVATAAVAMAQEDCAAELTDYASCIKAAKEEHKAQREEHHRLKDLCFSDNGCTAPEHNSRNKTEIKECIRNAVQPEIQSCLDSNQVSLPEDFLAMSLQCGGRKHGRHGRRHRSSSSEQSQADDACPNQDSADRVVVCLQDLEENKPDRGQFKEQCEELLSESCAAEKDAAKQEICNCGKGLRDSPNVEAILEEVAQCSDGEMSGRRMLRKVFKGVCGRGRRSRRGRKGRH